MGKRVGRFYSMCTLHRVIYGTINKRTVMAWSRSYNETLDGNDFVWRCSDSTEPYSYHICAATSAIVLSSCPYF